MGWAAGCCGDCPQPLAPPSSVGQPALTTDVAIDQTQLMNGAYSVRQVLEAGGHIFSTPFTRADGFGEGVNGPRRGQREFFFHTLVKPGVTPPLAQDYPFQRLDGLDSQSCFECHNSIGSALERGVSSQALIRKHGTVGGSGGFNANAFINNEFPGGEKPGPIDPGRIDPSAAAPGTPYHMVKFVRNPPHAFGSGYVQQVAHEMSKELAGRKAVADVVASIFPGQQVSIAMTAKTTDYGIYQVRFDTTSNSLERDFSTVHGLARNLMADNAGVITEGVPDLVIRPFQWKGIASTLRHFVRDALDFHFSMQAEEKVRGEDKDGDGPANEVTEGEVSALAAFTGMIRPPVELTPPGWEARAALGRHIFTGNLSAAEQQQHPGLQAKLNATAASGRKMCATCHTPSLPLDNPVFVIDDPDDVMAMARRYRPSLLRAAGQADAATRPAVAPQGVKQHIPSLIDPVPPEESPVLQEMILHADALKDAMATERPIELPEGVRPQGAGPQDAGAAPSLIDMERRFQQATEALRASSGGKAIKASTAAADSSGATGAYRIDLTHPGAGDAHTAPVPNYALPRLPEKSANGHRRVNVPLYSDLALHDMGSTLADVANQQTDIGGVYVPKPMFLTRPLWGVADTGPWLHDGRALTLLDAIKQHGDSASGSEAGNVVNVFEGLTTDEQQALVDFLMTLRLPVQKELCSKS